MKTLSEFTSISLLLIFTKCVSIEGTTTQSEDFSHKKFTTEDHIYESNIKTVRLYPNTGLEQDLLKPAVIHISQKDRLLLQFDELYMGPDYYNIKIIHCNSDWSKSLLNDVEFLEQFNRFNISNYQTSINTKVNYTHYEFEVPKVKISGNYLIQVYRENNENDLILCKRFSVYDPKVLIKSEVALASDTRVRRMNQQINFDILHPNYQINNPREELKVVIRQNQRWDNAITDIKPLFIRSAQKEIEYRHFNNENNFKGGNEFRAFDLQNIRALGYGIDKVDIKATPIYVELEIEKNRSDINYNKRPDLNGKYYINNILLNSGAIDGDYAQVTFKLNSTELEKDIYVFGELSNWKLDKDFKLKYNKELEIYECTSLLKQGYYNYAFALEEEGQPELSYFEGSHFNTSNQYEIMVYYRPIGGRSDLLIGYADLISEEF